jgi:hypothetical protein
MHRFIAVLAATLLLSLNGCGTSPVSSEQTREVVLQYLGTDVGTAGPFYQGGKKELDILSAGDRQKADALIDQGAALFLIYAAPGTTNAGHASRVILVHRGSVVGDFNATGTAK